MPITDLVAPEAILPALKVNSKKQALQELAARAAELTGQNERSVFEVLLQREKLGTTAVGYGVAIPHTASCPSWKRFLACSRVSIVRSISNRWMASRSISSSCCSPPKAPAPIT
ncbi:hypothetical protein ACVWW4_005376 [Bradyrhizobium sp. LB7.1]